MNARPNEASARDRPPPLVLVVDDAPPILRLVRLALSTLGVRVETAETGSDALRKLAEMTPDLVLLDLRLPDVRGIDLLRAIRDRSPLPVIVFTAMSDDEVLSEALALGAADIVRKPFSPDRLASVVSHILFGPTAGRGMDVVIRARDVEINVGATSLRVRGQPVHLGRSEWLLLSALALHQGRPRLHQELLVEAWGPDYRNDVDYLRLMIDRLRSKLEDHDGNLIRSYLDVGFSLTG